MLTEKKLGAMLVSKRSILFFSARIALSGLLAWANVLLAEELETLSDPPPPPPPMESGEPLEPDVTIVQRKEATIEEYRVNGVLYMVKIVPVVGKPYYLIDRNGDGIMETKRGLLYNDPVPAQWLIFSW